MSNDKNIRDEVKKSLEDTVKKYDGALRELAKGPDDKKEITDNK